MQTQREGEAHEIPFLTASCTAFSINYLYNYLISSNIQKVGALHRIDDLFKCDLNICRGRREDKQEIERAGSREDRKTEREG